MLVVCHSIKKKYHDFPPQLVVEILSPATADKDRFVKYPIYKSQHIPYYLVVEPEAKEIGVYEYKNDRYQLMQKGRNFIILFI